MNPRRGEAPIQLGEREYTLRLTMNTLAAIEKVEGKSFHRVFQDLGIGSLATIIALGIKHQEPKITPRKVADRLDGNQLEAYTTAITKALSLCMYGTEEPPMPEETEDPLP